MFKIFLNLLVVITVFLYGSSQSIQLESSDSPKEIPSLGTSLSEEASSSEKDPSKEETTSSEEETSDSEEITLSEIDFFYQLNLLLQPDKLLPLTLDMKTFVDYFHALRRCYKKINENKNHEFFANFLDNFNLVAEFYHNSRRGLYTSNPLEFLSKSLDASIFLACYFYSRSLMFLH
jgi:hypothetical protein